MQLIVGNWKMNGLMSEARDLAAALVKCAATGQLMGEMVLCPPFPYLNVVQHRLVGSPIVLGAQDCHSSAKGAFTGDISATMLADVGCKYVIVGHSERRQTQGESSELVKAKAEAAHAAGLIPIICIGETKEERDTGSTMTVLSDQLRSSLPGNATAENTVIAYEPVWAIGTGDAAKPADLQVTYTALRKLVTELVSDGKQLRLLYGGSVKSSNASQLMAINDVNGFLVGGASLVADDFWAISSQQHNAA